MPDDLYHDLLLRHSRHPRGHGALSHATHAADGLNPLCGDQIQLELRQAGNTVTATGFEGRSCAICTASASLLASTIVGHSLEETRAIAGMFRLAMTSLDAPAGLPPDLEMLANVRRFPGRVRCAMLPWETLLSALLHPVGEITHIFLSPAQNDFGHHDDGGQITFIMEEALDELREGLRVPQTRRDPAAARHIVVTRNIDLPPLVGREFVLQGIRFLGTEECPPCRWRDEAVAVGAMPWLQGRGGLRARILSDGELHIGPTRHSARQRPSRAA